MQDRPSAPDLMDAIAEFLLKDVMPAIKDQDDLLSYKALVSWNMLGVVAREMREGETMLNAELDRARKLLTDAAVHAPDTLNDKQEQAREFKALLTERIKSEKIADPDHPVWKHVKQSLVENLAVANPRFNTGQ